MSNSNETSNEVEILNQFFAAINRNDLATAIAFFAPDILRKEPEGFPTSGTYHGASAVAANLTNGRGTWAEGSCDPEGFFQNGSKVVVYLHAHVRLHGATAWVGGRFADGFVVRHGKLVEYHSFAEREQAMAWAGITDGGTP